MKKSHTILTAACGVMENISDLYQKTFFNQEHIDGMINYDKWH